MVERTRAEDWAGVLRWGASGPWGTEQGGGSNGIGDPEQIGAVRAVLQRIMKGSVRRHRPASQRPGQDWVAAVVGDQMPRSDGHVVSSLQERGHRVDRQGDAEVEIDEITSLGLRDFGHPVVVILRTPPVPRPRPTSDPPGLGTTATPGSAPRPPRRAA